MRALTTVSAHAALLASAGISFAIPLNVDSTESVLKASKILVDRVLGVYDANNIPGLLGEPYYFWESGLALDSLINYWALSNDNSVVSPVQMAMFWQVASDNDFKPLNQTKSEGNNDQATWALAAMTAAERGFPAPPDASASYIQLAQNVFNEQVARWDDQTCNGGLRWQIFSFNNGYNYKNMMSQGSFAQLAGRLYRFTGNETYMDWARKTFEWSNGVGLIDSNGNVYDGTDTTDNCSDLNHIQWTSNAGLLIGSAAYLINATSDSNDAYWLAQLGAITDRSVQIFTKAPTSSNSTGGSVLYEVACAASGNCNVDQLAFKAILARAFTRARDMIGGENIPRVDDTSDTTVAALVDGILRSSAQAAAAQCTGGDSGTVCASSWIPKYDTFVDSRQGGVGQDLSALEVFLANLPAKPLLTSKTGAAASNGTAATGGNSGSAGNGTNAGGTEGSTGGAAGLPSLSTFAIFATMGVVAAFSWL